MLYGHGNNGYQYRQKIVADFSTNVWCGGEPAGLKEHLFGRWKQVNSYPEVVAESLAVKAARHHSLDPENILVTNGTTESIYLVAQAFRHKHSGIFIPSFAEYEDACDMHEHRIRFLTEEVWAGGDLSNKRIPADWSQDLLWICHPNNPTGREFAGIETLIRKHPGILFIVDEAFIEFTLSAKSVIPLLPEQENLIVLRSLTKSFAIPGLRLGYIVAHEKLVKKLVRLKLPWSVNMMAIEAGNFLFDRYEKLRPPLEMLLNDKADFVRQLGEGPLLVHPSHTHFFLCETLYSDATVLQHYLLERHGILIRDASNFRGLGEKHFRIATLAPFQNQSLVNALKEWTKQYS